MKLHVWGRFWIGIGIGTVIERMITLLVSYIHNDGACCSAMPHLNDFFAREIDAVMAQFLLFALIGAVFAEAGIVFLIEKWSFLLKCLVHFAITSTFFVPFLWLCFLWQDPWLQLLNIFINLLLSYLIAWLTSYFYTRSDVGAINRKIKETRRTK